MTRKRRRPTPHFKIPPPFHPIDGEHAMLRDEGISPHCAMMQVAAVDTHDDYVVCRGYDPRVKRFFDYDATDLATKPGLSVGKPYGKRSPGIYEVGQIFPAFIPVTRIGQTPGKAATSSGYPADLDEEVEILYDDNEKVVTWFLIDSEAPLKWFELKEKLELGLTALAHPLEWNGLIYEPDLTEANEFTVYDPLGIFEGWARDGEAVPVQSGAWGLAVYKPDRETWIIIQMQRVASMISASVNEATNVAASDATFAIDEVAIIAPAGATMYPGATPATAPVVCNNALRIPAQNNAGVIAFYNNNTGFWEGFPQAYTSECP